MIIPEVLLATGIGLAIVAVIAIHEVLRRKDK